MQQVDANLYRVRPGEVVRVEFNGNDGADPVFVSFAVDGAPAARPPLPPVHQFNVTKPVQGEHRGVAVYVFPPGWPAAASFDTRVSGSFGGSFSGPHVTREGLLTQDLGFEVV